MEKLIKLGEFFISNKGELNFLSKIIKIIILIIGSRIVANFLVGLISSTFKRKERDSKRLEDTRRLNTINRMSQRVVRVLIYFYCTIMVLEVFNIDTKSILATAGIGGIAIGFGAQSLVKDIINGFFILQDDLFLVGDHISVKGLEGIVEDLSLRLTKIRDFNGDLHIVPNGEITLITNMSRGAKRARVVITIAYEENISKAIKVLSDLCQEISQEFQDILVVDPKVDGVVQLGDSGVDLRITAMTKSGEHWALERIIKQRAKESLEENNIEIPYSKLVVYKK